MKLLRIERGIVNGLAYSGDGRYLVSVNSSTTLRFWSLADYKEKLRVELPTASSWANGWVGPGERRDSKQRLYLLSERVLLATSYFDLSAAWKVLDGSPVPEDGPLWHEVHLKGAREFALLAPLPDGQVLGSCSDWPRPPPPSLRRWSALGEEVWRVRNGLLAPGLAVRLDGKLAAGTRGPVALVDLESGEEVAVFDHQKTPRAREVCFCPNGRLLASSAGPSVWLWDADRRGLVTAPSAIAQFPPFGRLVECLAFHPSGRLVGAGSRDGEVRLWDVESGKEVWALDLGLGAVHGLAFSPDGMTVAAACHKAAIAVRDLE